MENAHWYDDPVQLPVFPILVGSGRTGLTLLRMILDSHPEMAMAHEARFLGHMAKKHRTYEGGAALDIDRFVTDLYGFPHFRRLGLARDDVREALTSAAPSSFADGVRVVFGLYARSQGKSRYGEKGPLYISHLDLLAELFPEARFVHVIRDGRDVVMAYMEAEQAAPRDVAWGAFHWRLRVSRGRKSGRRLGPGRYREYRYEALVERPEEVVREICEFIDLEYDAQMFTYQEKAESFLADAKHPDDHQHLRLAPTKGLLDWREQMSPDDVALFEGIAGDLLEELGYPLGADQRVSRLVVWKEWLAWQWRRVTWRVRWRFGDPAKLRAGSAAER
jgi:hypothetical protein